MPAYGISFCPHCRFPLHGGRIPSMSVNKPYQLCPSCGGLIVDKKKSEWDSKFWIEKFGYVLYHSISVLFYGGGIGVAFWKLVTYLTGINENWGGYVFGYLIGVAFFSKILFKNIQEEIKESRIRLEDSKYREALKSLDIPIYSGKYKNAEFKNGQIKFISK